MKKVPGRAAVGTGRVVNVDPDTAGPVAKNRELGDAARDSLLVLIGCCGAFSGSGSSFVWNGLETEVPSSRRCISREPCSPIEVVVLRSLRGEVADTSRQ
jgi:hypothetical protein